ncbi:serralysin [Sinorhizobium meliloti]|uniref:calcium-binding protein n=1 Tax=Rhizobium meliloti TaxID=382 RepID=UPI000FD981DB|nr:calcium-binding protein [Sinorhizobium meliloti]RVH13847.1 calcium-binding protein [Sinorhizobium meliloti]
MATVTYHFPAGLYPNQYNPPISGVGINPSFGELVDMSKASRSTTSSTEVLYRLDNGLKLKLIGSGITFSSNGDAVGGTITSIEVLLNNGTTLVQSISGIDLSLEVFQDAAAAFDNLELENWLLTNADTVNGSAGDDDISGRLGDDILIGNGGDDIITGGHGDDTYDGGTGYDILNFQDAYDASSAKSGINLNATNGTVTDQFGFSETFQNFEEYRGTQFGDTIIGSALNEAFMGLGGRDTINGGAGTDLVRYDRDAQRGGSFGVNVNLSTGVAFDGFRSQDTLTGIEDIRGTEFKDSLVGNAGANFLRGHAGDDILNGAGGIDSMRGGQGNDLYVVDNGGDLVNEAADSGAGTDTVRSSLSFNLANAAVVSGSVEHLTLFGTGNTNGAGNALANVLNGNDGNNALNGRAGNDLLNGGLGSDTLIGSTGLDTFFFNTALNTSSNVDIITDFTVVDDTMRLENGVFTAITGTGALSTAQFVANATGTAEDSSDRIIYETDTGRLLYDSNGSAAGGSIHFATVSFNLALTSADFIIV